MGSPNSDINVVYLSSYLGKGEAAGHRCDNACQVEHVWANLYCCKSSNVTHVCDKNCDQRILYDRHTTLCKFSGKYFPLSLGEQQAIAGVRRKREAEQTETSTFKRRRDGFCNPATPFASPFLRSFPAFGRVGYSDNFMDIQQARCLLITTSYHRLCMLNVFTFQSIVVPFQRHFFLLRMVLQAEPSRFSSSWFSVVWLLQLHIVQLLTSRLPGFVYSPVIMLLFVRQSLWLFPHKI